MLRVLCLQRDAIQLQWMAIQNRLYWDGVERRQRSDLGFLRVLNKKSKRLTLALFVLTYLCRLLRALMVATYLIILHPRG